MNRICRVPMIGRSVTFYISLWASNTTIETLSSYARGLGMKLCWDKETRGLAIK